MAKTWTVMVYMVANKDAQLDAVAVEDLREMERGVNDSTNVVVQIHRAWPETAQRYHVTSHDSKLAGPIEVTNMATRESLAAFLADATEQYPAERYCLILWGHAYGLGFGREHSDKLTLAEIKWALDQFRSARKQQSEFRADEPLDLLGANACAMSYAEAAHELRDSARYMVASQIAVPLIGWPFESILKRLAPETSARELGTLIVDEYVAQYNAMIGGERVTMTLLDLAHAEALKAGVQTLGKAIAAAVSPKGKFNSDTQRAIQDVFVGAAAGDVRPLLDLRDLCLDLTEFVALHGDGAESKALGVNAKKLAALVETGNLVAHHRGHPDLDDLHGLGIFAPFVTDAEELRRLELENHVGRRRVMDKSNGQASEKTVGREDYENLDIFVDARIWPTLVYDGLRQPAPSEVAKSLNGSLLMETPERRDVMQIVLAIDSAFNKLDRVLAKAHTCVEQALDGRPGAASSDNGARWFGPPFLRLIQPPDAETQVETLERLLTLKNLEDAAKNGRKNGKKPARTTAAQPHTLHDAASRHPEVFAALNGGDPRIVSEVVAFFASVETAVGEVERAAKKGLTHARFGLGPIAPQQFRLGEGPKSGHGLEGPKSGHGSEGPKSGHGSEGPKSGHGDEGANGASNGASGDLRIDRAFARVTDLFRQVGETMQRLEQATAEVESTARAVLADASARNFTKAQLMAAAGSEIARAFRILEEASVDARRTVRNVLSHPIYGLGPASVSLRVDERLAMASAGGLDRRSLRLL